jgi:hypothetical protein
MRCLACNNILTQGEDARKFEGSNERVGLCNNCSVFVPLPMVGGDEPYRDEAEWVLPAEEDTTSYDGHNYDDES